MPWVLLTWLFLFLLTVTEGQAQDILSVTKDWTAPEYNQKIASVGDLDISAMEFLLSYEFGPAFFKRSDQSKTKYLSVMIYEKLLALEGYRQGLDQNESVRLNCKAYAEDLMTEELFKEKIMSRINVSANEIDQAIPLEKQHISLRWLYCNDKEQIDRRWQKLNKGVSFDSLFAEQLGGTIAMSDRSLSTTRYDLSLKNPLLAAVVKNLPSGAFSAPIEVSDGWYIVKTENIWTDLITTESEENKLRYELQRSIFKQKLDRASDIYVKNLMDEENPQIEKVTFAEVALYINMRLADSLKYDQNLIAAKLGRADHERIEATPSSDLGGHILVLGNSCRISFNDFIDWYRPRTAYIKFNSHSVEKFILAVQQTVWRMVRDFLLIEQARQIGLDKREAVIEQVKWWEEKFVFNAVKMQTAASIKFKENDLQTYYNENRSDYRDQSGQILSFEKARNNVQNDYLREKYMNTLMHRVLALKKEYDVYINEDILKNIKVQEEENPLAIDLYTVKKGGLLPRQPYPTIDWEWQLWY